MQPNTYWTKCRSSIQAFSVGLLIDCAKCLIAHWHFTMPHERYRRNQQRSWKCSHDLNSAQQFRSISTNAWNALDVDLWSSYQKTQSLRLRKVTESPKNCITSALTSYLIRKAFKRQSSKYSLPQTTKMSSAWSSMKHFKSGDFSKHGYNGNGCICRCSERKLVRDLHQRSDPSRWPGETFPSANSSTTPEARSQDWLYLIHCEDCIANIKSGHNLHSIIALSRQKCILQQSIGNRARGCREKILSIRRQPSKFTSYIQRTSQPCVLIAHELVPPGSQIE